MRVESEKGRVYKVKVVEKREKNWKKNGVKGFKREESEEWKVVLWGVSVLMSWGGRGKERKRWI